MTEQLDGSMPGIAASSYAADPALLAELRATWPPSPAPSDGPIGYVAADIRDRPPAFALRIGPRYAIALVPEIDVEGAFLAVPLARDAIVVTAWRPAIAGEGLSAFVAGVPLASERPLGVDQTNSSVVVGERAIVKWFRRVGPGPSRAATLIAHLDAVGFAELPAPLGSLVWARADGPHLTIAQGDVLLDGARDGWEWCLERVERHVAHGRDTCPATCDPWFGERLGRLVARLHAALATRSAVIAAPIATADAATFHGWWQTALARLDEALALGAGEADPLADLGPTLRAAVASVARPAGVAIQPVHGDLHVGQVLEWPGGLAVIDFDGNPALGPDGNAIRQPVERDIAQMTSSLDHLGRIVDQRTGGAARDVVDGWIDRTRREFLSGLDRAPDDELLAAFEVEQECRELVYASRFLPRWRFAPVASLRARYGG